LELEAVTTFARTTRRIGAAIAREVGLNEKTVQDWGNVESGDRPPHLLLLYITQLALEMRPLPRDRAECFAALDFVEAQLGRVAFALPTPEAVETPAGRAFLAAQAVVQLGEFLSLANDDPGTAGRTRLAQELADVVAVLQALMPKEEVGA
jgi:hypothetical protein